MANFNRALKELMECYDALHNGVSLTKEEEDTKNRLLEACDDMVVDFWSNERENT